MTRRLVFTGDMALERIFQGTITDEASLEKFVQEVRYELTQAKYFGRTTICEMWREVVQKNGAPLRLE